MNKKILFLIFSISLLSLFLVNSNSLNEIEGEITKIDYRSYGVLLFVKAEEFIILENTILNLSQGDYIEIKYKNQKYKSEQERVVEKIIKYN